MRNGKRSARIDRRREPPGFLDIIYDSIRAEEIYLDSLEVKLYTHVEQN